MDKHLVIDEEKAPAVRAVFEIYEKNHNLMATRRMLRDEYGIDYEKLLHHPVYMGAYKILKGSANLSFRQNFSNR